MSMPLQTGNELKQQVSEVHSYNMAPILNGANAEAQNMAQPVPMRVID